MSAGWLKKALFFVSSLILLLCAAFSAALAEPNEITAEVGKPFTIPVYLLDKTKLSGSSVEISFSFLQGQGESAPSFRLESATSLSGRRASVNGDTVRVEATSGSLKPGLLTEIRMTLLDKGSASDTMMLTVRLRQSGKSVQSTAYFISVATQKRTLSTPKPTQRVTPTPTPKPTPRVSVGDRITLGSYEQDNNRSNGKEPITWIVLKKEGDRVLVISEKILDRQTYHPKQYAVTWETCWIREWLNDDFLNTAFSYSEQQQILTVTVPAQDNPKYKANKPAEVRGNDTRDKIFLLNGQEALDLFRSDSDRMAYPTRYAVARGIDSKSVSKTATWFLRQPHKFRTNAPCINSKGGLDGINVSFDQAGIRPAMWIQLK